jgi:hypothetical protein
VDRDDVDLRPFLEELFPEVDFTKPEDAHAAAAWVLENREEFAEALRAFVERGGFPEPPGELDELL